MKKRGILLITTLMIVVIVAMVVLAAISLAPTSMVSASNYTDSQRAMLAVDAGVAYAKARLKEDMTWRASPDSGPNTIVRTPDNSMVIMEDHGNVVGLIKFDSGQYGQFRVRFNHQNGPTDPDGLDDPSPNFNMDTPSISNNNMLGSAPTLIYRAPTPYSTPEAMMAQAATATDFVQPFQAFIAVEGRAGPGLRNADPYNPNQVDTSLRIVTRVAEARIQADFGDTLDAAAMAAGDINAYFQRSGGNPSWQDPNAHAPRLTLRTMQSSKDRVPPRIRTKGAIHVANEQGGNSINLYSSGGFVNTADGSLGPTTNANNNITTQTESQTADFYNLEWDKLNHASSDPNSSDTVNLKAGTYVMREIGPSSNPKPKLHYYDMGLDDYLTYAKANPSDLGQPLSSNLQEVRNNFSQVGGNAVNLHVTNHTANPNAPASLKGQLLFRKDTFVEPTANTSEFSFLPEYGFVDGPSTNSDPHPGTVDSSSNFRSTSLMMQFRPREGEDIAFTSPGKININARVHGLGAAITSENDIKIVGAGTLAGTEVGEGGDGLSLYSKKDITVNTYRPRYASHTSGTYSDMRLSGVVYAWGDIDFELGPPEHAPQPSSFYYANGALKLKGAMVAYGGDPADVGAEPGSGSGGIGPGRGNINISARHAELAYDTRYLLAFDKLATPAGMDVVSWTLVK